MKSNDLRLPLVVGLVLILAQLPLLSASSSIGKVVPVIGVTTVNGTRITLDTTVFSGDTVATQARGSAVLMLPMGGKARLGSATSATFNNNMIVLTSGVTRVHAGVGQTVLVNALGLVVRGTEGSTFEVGIDGASVIVAARTGNVEVVGMNSSLPIAEGNVMRFETVSKAEAMAATRNGQQFIWTPQNAFWIAVIVSIGGSFLVSAIIHEALEDDPVDPSDAIAAAIAAFCAQVNVSLSPSIVCPAG